MPEPTSDEIRLGQLEREVMALQDVIKSFDELPQGSAGEGQEPPFTPFYPSVQEWVEGHFAQVYVRNIEAPEMHWCTRWWDHSEAAIRLTYLWEVWELTRGKRGSAAWWNALDHHLPILLSPTGPLGGCSRDGHHPFPALPVIGPPSGWGDQGAEPN